MRVTRAAIGILLVGLIIAIVAGTYLDPGPARAEGWHEAPMIEPEDLLTDLFPTFIPEPPPLTIPDIIILAARVYDVSPTTMLRIAWCESKHNPAAIGFAGHLGLFQFAASTWAYASHRAGFGGWSPFNPTANAHAAAWLYRAEGPRHWTCK